MKAKLPTLCWLALAAMIAGSRFASAECALPPVILQRIEILKQIAKSPQADIELGLAQVDIPACLDEAKLTFQQLSQRTHDEQKHFAEGMLALIGARNAILRGDRSVSALRSVATTYPEGPVYVRAVQDMTLLLDSQPAAPEWQFLAQELEKMAVAEDASGLAADAVGHLARHDINVGHSEQGLSAMEVYLAKPHSVQIRLKASIIYIELLLAAGQRADARTLSSVIDGDIGRMELDPALRLRFLEACTSAYSGLNDPQSRLRYQRYAAGLEQARRELQ